MIERRHEVSDKTATALLAVVLAITANTPAIAVTLTKIPFETAARSSWAEVIEAEDAAVTKSGNFSVFNVAPKPWNSGVWLLDDGAYIQMSFTTPADTLVVQFESDSNDGLAELIVDGTSVGTIDTFNGGWFGIRISGLRVANHTLRIRAAGGHLGDPSANDVAIDVAGAVLTTALPDPTSLDLLNVGRSSLSFVVR